MRETELAAALATIFFVAFVLTHATVPWLHRALIRARIVEKDVHKLGFPEIPTMGGLGIFAGVAAALTMSGILNLEYRFSFAIFLSATLAALAGLVDDLFKLSKSALVALTFLISLPVIAFQAGTTLVYLTPVGPRDLGWFFWLLVPFAFAFLMNGVNIYAGFNGLEAGLGFVSSLSLGICAVMYGSWESAVSLFALSGALLSFLRWNWFPAKIFIGNTGTFLIGAVLVASIIAGTIKLAGVIALFPYIINFILRARDRFITTVADIETLADGTLSNNKLTALWALFMYRSPVKESAAVTRCLLVQAIFGVFAIVFAYYHANLIPAR